MHFFHFGTSLQVPLQYKCGSCIHNHSETRLGTVLMERYCARYKNHIVAHWSSRIISSRCCIHMHPWCTGPISAINIMVVWPFFNCLHHFVTWCTLFMLSPYRFISWWLILGGEKGRSIFYPYNPYCSANLFPGWSFEYCCQFTWAYPQIASESLNDSCAICCMPPTLHLLWPAEK